MQPMTLPYLIFTDVNVADIFVYPFAGVRMVTNSSAEVG